MYQGTETYHINSVEPIEIFYPIRTDLDKLKYAVHITKIVKDVTTQNQNCYRILQLFLNTLYTISEIEKDLDLVINIFKFRLLSILGFLPRVKECTNCGKTEELNFFSIKEDGFKCSACAKQDKSCIEMRESTKNAIEYILFAPAKKIFSFDLKEESRKELDLITRIYFNEKIEKEYKLDDMF